LSWFRRTPLGAARWIAIDCETSGLDTARDRLLSVGAVPVRDGRIFVADAFHAFVKQQSPSAVDNILVHGIGGDAQLAGLPVEQVIAQLGAAAGECIPVGFHAPFDEAILRRHGFAARSRWIDLAAVGPALFPQRKSLTSLEEWLGAFGIPVEARHDALGDAFSTAQLLLVVLAEAGRQRVRTVEELRRLQGAARWL
jgi:DNA polymerase III subunit epsilon